MDKERIENAIRHIQTATDIDPWAVEIAVYAMQRMLDVDCDLISRQAIDKWKNDFKGYVNALNIPRDDYNGIMAYIDELPSVQSDRKTGVWRLVTPASYSFSGYRCSECNELVYGKTNYCPNCGADMRGDQDE